MPLGTEPFTWTAKGLWIYALAKSSIPKDPSGFPPRLTLFSIEHSSNEPKNSVHNSISSFTSTLISLFDRSRSLKESELSSRIVANAGSD